ncbi:oxidoreductase, short-chain dehydrogenase/reductase family protein [Oceanicola granulosus HTCC2516]|uniref:Oxidoreductase, short-chain dehydrogenase/reductase family protein n=1 Tax=Oceanicola granulosus (strain ATCC BAA-861 / DSM 15982 / KCTC 12143 / HTCC2516) TaxID=314256 RepID=Q2CAW9_OCEGH|nr:SDR family NAD(P)-dependent oxidoreductase [Oceanicola granulosus]EAR49807.1 oxidoreductase, short-chain dehydrogenase/reductase family protein [Oceanicola granulosus HTCC2516]
MTRTILITGCSTGIGRDAALTLTRRGWHVVASARQPDDVAALRADGLEAVRLDYEDSSSIESGLAEALDLTGGRLDALFNNGAYAVPGPLEDIPAGAMQAIFQANFLGWHDLTRRVLPVMRAQGAGRIVNCSSILGLIGTKYRGAYVATKFALEGWSDVLRMEMREAGIDVVLIEPGPIETPFRANAIKQFERWIDWEKSPRADEYRASLLDRLYKGSAGPSWPASAVTDVLVRALDARRPRARYYVTPHTKVAALGRRVLSARGIDRLVRRA